VIGPHSELLILVSGIAFFMYGMGLASDYLQKIAANRVRQLMSGLADRPFVGIGVGVLLTILLQSSGAVTSMLVNLGSAGVVNLSQVMGVIIGSAIGSTLTVQIISFKLSQWGLSLFLVAYTVFFLSKKRIVRNCSGVVMGFGLIFFGLELMSLATTAFKEHQWVLNILQSFRAQPLITVLVTAAISGFVHSSAVIIGFAMTLASTGLLSMNEAMYWIYGANIGTTSTAILASIGTNHIGRQVAWSHFFYKVGSVLIFLPVTYLFSEFIFQIEPSLPRAIANAHTIFNILTAIIFYPFIVWGSRVIESIFTPTKEERAFGPKFLNDETSSASTIAYSQALRESFRMSDIVSSMVKDSLKLFESQNPDLVEDIHERDNKVDILFREIKSFLVRFSDEFGHFNRQTLELLSYVTDLEAAADIVDKSMVELSTKKHELKLEFSTQGWIELQSLHNKVMEIISGTVSCIQLQDKDFAEKIIDQKRALRTMERCMRESHLERLNQGLRESINTSSIHLELLSDLRRIAGLISNRAYAILNDDKETKTSK